MPQLAILPKETPEHSDVSVTQYWNVVFSEERRVIEYIPDPFDGYSTALAMNSIMYQHMESVKNDSEITILFGIFTKKVDDLNMIGASLVRMTVTEFKKMSNKMDKNDEIYFYIGEMESDSYLKCKAGSQLPFRVSRLNNIPSECQVNLSVMM